MILCATPKYLNLNPKIIKEPSDIIDNKHQLILLNNNNNTNGLFLRRITDAKQINYNIQAKITCDNMLVTRALTLAHLGISFQVKREVQDLLDKAELIHILPDWISPMDMIVYAVTLGKTQSYKVAYFIELLKKEYID